MAGAPGRSGGRNAQSAADHVIRGTFRSDRHDDDMGVTAEPGRPESPRELVGEALAEWDRMIDRLEKIAALSVVDGAALYQYCQLFAETEAIALSQAEVAASADIVEENLSGLKGAELVQAFQEITKLRALEARYTTQVRQGRMSIRAYLVEFGMTPAARSRVKPTKKPDAPKSKWGKALA